jgi:LAS superfamily LD-carboxypeptidase LdcB
VGIDGINSRIADIQSRIIALQTQQAGTATKAASSSTSATGGTSFQSYLNQAVQSQAPAAAKSYQLNGQGIPTDLAAYGNGKIPPSALAPVGDTEFKLWAPAAESLTSMIAAAKKDGVTIGINESYRPYEEQVALAKQKGLYSQGGLAAKPGTSEHGWGMAADLQLNGQALTWMRQNAGKYGFDNNVPRENWHWAYKPAAA